MKFNVDLPEWRKEFLEEEYRAYARKTPMNQKERRALRKWVKNGNSVYENACGAWRDGQVPAEFLDVWREEEYIRQHTKGMEPKAAYRFTLEYYGYDDADDGDDIPLE